MDGRYRPEAARVPLRTRARDQDLCQVKSEKVFWPRLFGIPILTSPYVPRLECFEADYSRPLIRRLLEGRTVDLREWEEDQIFLMPLGGPNLIMTPEMYGVIQGLLP